MSIDTKESTYFFDPFHGFDEKVKGSFLTADQDYQAIQCVTTDVAFKSYIGSWMTHLDYLSRDMCEFRLRLWGKGIPSRPQIYRASRADYKDIRGRLILGSWDRREVAHAIETAFYLMDPRDWKPGQRQTLAQMHDELKSETHAVPDGVTFVAIDLLSEIGFGPLAHLNHRFMIASALDKHGYE